MTIVNPLNLTDVKTAIKPNTKVIDKSLSENVHVLLKLSHYYYFVRLYGLIVQVTQHSGFPI